MPILSVAVLEGGDYRVAQNDHGAPFIQFLDEETKEWIAVRRAPERLPDLERLLAKYAAQALVAKGKLVKATREAAAYKEGFESRGKEIEELKRLKERLVNLAEAV